MHPAQDWAISYAYARRYGLSTALGVAAEETVEGDKSGKTTSGFDDPRGDGVLSVRGVIHKSNATMAERAKGNAEGVEAQMKEAATVKGLDGVWERNLDVINTLSDHFPDHYNNIVAVYEQNKAGMGEG